MVQKEVTTRNEFLKMNKFRIWDRQNKCFIKNEYGLYCYSEFLIDPFTKRVYEVVTSLNGDHTNYENKNVIYHPYHMDGIRLVKEPRYIVQMSSGLPDIMNKEIYEGDILRILKGPDKEMKGEVVFWNGAFCLQNKEDIHEDNRRWWSESIIIGNIFS